MVLNCRRDPLGWLPAFLNKLRSRREAPVARRLSVPLTKPKAQHWLTGIGAAILALCALVAGSAFGSVRGHSLEDHLIAWISAAVLLVSGTFAVTRSARLLGRLAAHGAIPSIGSAVRILAALGGYLIVALGVLTVLQVSVGRLLVGAGLLGVVLGIAATQSLGNVFAGMILMVTRPFAVGDHIRVRSGSLGGVFDAWVLEMALTYTTLSLEDGTWKMPNSALLAAGVGQLSRRPGDPVPPLPQVLPSPAPAAPAPQPSPTAAPPRPSPAGSAPQPSPSAEVAESGSEADDGSLSKVRTSDSEN